MVVISRYRNTYRGTPRTVTPVSAFTARRERAAERSNARRTLIFNNPYTRSITARRLMGYRTGPAKSIGFPSGTKTQFCNNTISKWSAANATVNTRTLTTDIITAVARQDAGNEINLRERDMINCKGFTLRFHLSNSNPSSNLQVRLALVYDKNKTSWTDTDFFRGYDDSRTLDFDGSATGLEACQLMSNPINRDKYVVLWEKKVELGPDADTTGGASFERQKSNSLTFNTYVSLHRQLRYTGIAATSCADNIFLIAWADIPSSGQTGEAPNVFSYRRFGVMHWNDPK